jgi:thiamine pyridinylase
MRKTSFHQMRAMQVAVALVLAIAATLAPVSSQAADPPATGNGRPLRISLFPYVPNPKSIQDIVHKRWKASHPDIPLKFLDREDFDSYKQDPPDDLDVFEFDGIGLDYYVRNSFVTPLSQDEIQEPEDILDFAWKGSMVDGRVYAIPRLACTYVLIYRKTDKAVSEAVGLHGLYNVLGDGRKKLAQAQTEPVPEDGKGLLIDMSGGTDCACLYLDAFEDLSGKYSVRPKLPNALELDTGGLSDLRLLAAMAGKPQALFAEPYQAPPKRPAWFGSGKGRAFVGYSERLYFIPKDAHSELRVRDLPMADQNRVNNLFVDMLGVNANLRGDRRKLAVELANLCASKDALLECLIPCGETSSQYLLPVRTSVLSSTDLLSKAPLYNDLGKLLEASTNPRVFRLGPKYRDWLELNKRLIQSRLFE